MNIQKDLFFRTNKKYTPQQRRDYVLSYTASGMKMHEWCIANDLSVRTFGNWLYKKSKAQNSPPVKPATWATVEVNENSGAIQNLPEVHHRAIRIDIAGITLQVEEGVRAEHLRMVLREVREL